MRERGMGTLPHFSLFLLSLQGYRGTLAVIALCQLEEVLFKHDFVLGPENASKKMAICQGWVLRYACWRLFASCGRWES